MKVGTGNLVASREYHKKLFGPLFYPWWNCPLRYCDYKSSTFLGFALRLTRHMLLLKYIVLLNNFFLIDDFLD